jgi:transposase
MLSGTNRSSVPGKASSMPRKQHIIRLTRDDRRMLQQVVRTGHRSAWSIQRARILLASDAAADGPALTDAVVAEQVGGSARTVARARSDWATRGLACLDRRPQRRPSVPPKLSDAQILEIAALACTDPPPGFARWSLRLLTTRVVELGLVDTIAPETIRKALQKGGSSLGAPSAS